eukprot:7383420-Prymnesium_polylepis.2
MVGMSSFCPPQQSHAALRHCACDCRKASASTEGRSDGKPFSSSSRVDLLTGCGVASDVSKFISSSRSRRSCLAAACWARVSDVCCRASSSVAAAAL